ncbi:histidinol dehydrogenase [Hyphobacterium indicum]|uniref:histidinol dehydrogenase n=1 Tax=Hyphobacterium indicum TaxID=2162714 RepID=UPI000D6538B8|nr:histidinol dehydrogenase [Hyphobacterium indicum]
MKRVIWKDLGDGARTALFSASPESDTARAAAIEIVEAIRREGDRAVFEYARRLDGFSGESFRVSSADIDAARAAADPEDIAAMEAAIAAVRAFHAKQGLGGYEIETWPGVTCRRRVDAIRSVGLYVPAGSAPLVSTLIMLAVPAQIAGVPEIAVTVPPGSDGRVNASVLAAASLLGLTDIFAIGGAQAIAALAFGAAGLPRVAKIFGPGNAWVAAAKSHVSTLPGGPAIDLPAGPSEVMVIADAGARPDFVAADLLAQAEHDPMAQVCLVSIGADISAIEAELARQLSALPRKAIAEQALSQGVMIEAGDRREAMAIAERACPEHLILQTDAPGELARDITTAGSIFLGAWTPESMGDYAAGLNHTLPTGGAGRAYSGVTVEAFQRTTTLIEASRSGAAGIAPVVERLAALEGLDAHATAMRLRRTGGGDE